MSSIVLNTPTAGEKTTFIIDETISEYTINFFFDEALFEKVDDRMEIYFPESDSTIVLDDFYAIYHEEFLPDFLLDGELIAGEDFFAAFDPELMPAMGYVTFFRDRANREAADLELANGTDALDGLLGESGYSTEPTLIEGESGNEGERTINSSGGRFTEYSEVLDKLTPNETVSPSAPTPTIRPTVPTPDTTTPTTPTPPTTPDTTPTQPVTPTNPSDENLEEVPAPQLPNPALTNTTGSIISDDDAMANDTSVTIALEEGISLNFSGTIDYIVNGEKYGEFTNVDGVLKFTQTKAFDHVGGSDNDSFTGSQEIPIIDAKGDVGSANITVTIGDSLPTAVADTASVDEGGSTRGNILTNDIDSADNVTISSLSAKESEGWSITQGADGVFTANHEIYGTLTVNPDGSYEFISKPNSVDSSTPNFVFNYTITDSDGDSATSTLTIDPNEAKAPELNEYESSVTVDESGLATGTDSTSTSETITWAPQPGYTLVGFEGYDPALFDVSLDYYGNYLTINLIDNITSHEAGDHDDSKIAGKVTVTLEDGLGNTFTVDLAINVHDDGPVITTDETYLGETSSDGEHSGDFGELNFGADGFKSIIINGVEGIYDESTGFYSFELENIGTFILNPNGEYTFTAVPDYSDNPDLTLHLEITDGDGDTASADLNLTIITNNVPSIDISSDNMSTYDDQNDYRDYNSDNDNDARTTNGSFYLNFGDDITVLTIKGADDVFTFEIDEYGEIITSIGEYDDINILLESLVINGTYGYLTNFTFDPASGEFTYTYVQNGSATDHKNPWGTQNSEEETLTDRFQITVSDTDSDESADDTATGEITVTINDDCPIITQLGNLVDHDSNPATPKHTEMTVVDGSATATVQVDFGADGQHRIYFAGDSMATVDASVIWNEETQAWEPANATWNEEAGRWEPLGAIFDEDEGTWVDADSSDDILYGEWSDNSAIHFKSYTYDEATNTHIIVMGDTTLTQVDGTNVWTVTTITDGESRQVELTFEDGDGDKVTQTFIAAEEAAAEFSSLHSERSIPVTGSELGTEETDIILGDENDNIILGLDGNDYISGGNGNDLIIGGKGSDILIGDAGKDVFSWESDNFEDGVNDIIRDFQTGDVLDLSAFANDFTFEVKPISADISSNGDEVYSDVEIIISKGEMSQTITLQDVNFSGQDVDDLKTAINGGETFTAS